MRKIVIATVSTLLMATSAFAQSNDSILYEFPFYFEDAVGNRDTVIIGGSPLVNGDEVNPEFGEINLINVPFDSVFEVRVTRAANLEIFGDSARYIGKKRILYYELGGIGDFPCDWDGGFDSFAFIANVANPPLTVSWSPERFRQTENIGCNMATAIVNSFLVNIIFPWWTSNDPIAVQYACIAIDSSITFHPFNTPSGLDLDWLTYSVHPVEGSANSRDTLPAYYLYFSYTGREPPPCNEAVDVEEPTRQILSPPFPNPTSHTLYFPQVMPRSTVDIFSTAGAVLSTQYIDREGAVDVRGYPPGVYFYRLTGPTGQHTTGRFVKR